MTKKSNVIGIVLIVAIALLVVGYGVRLSLKPSIIYDAKKTISGTNVTVSFPKNGYSGEGVTLGFSREASIMVFEKVANLYIESKPNGTPQIEVGVYALDGEKTLDDAIATLTRDQNPELTSGGYQTINDTRYFIQQEADGSLYGAYALVGDRLLNVNMQHGLDPSGASISGLFVQFLSRIDFTCKTDCSVNAGPVIDMGKPEEGQ